jgi:plastocyanin
MDPSTISLPGTFTLAVTAGGVAVPGTVSYGNGTALFTPSANLTASTQYTATITTAAKDLTGVALAANFVWSFTTGATPGTTRPTVSATVPANAATGVAIGGNISAAFSEAMDPLTITTTNFTVKNLPAGEYQVICNLHGGMVSKLVVH